MEHIKKLLEDKAANLTAKQPSIDPQALKDSFAKLTADLDFSIRIKGQKLILVTTDSMAATELFQRRAQILAAVKKNKHDITSVAVKTEFIS